MREEYSSKHLLCIIWLIFPHLDETLVWKRNIDADHRDQPGEFFLLVVIDVLSVLQDSGYGFDERDEVYKFFPEFRNVNDIEEDI